MADGEALFKAVRKKFFANFRVSVMLDSNGSNTTAAAARGLAGARPLARRQARRGAGRHRPGGPARRGDAGERRCARGDHQPHAGRGHRQRRRPSRARQDRGRRHRRRSTTPPARAPSRARTSCSPPARPVSRCSTRPRGSDHPQLELLSDANATPTLGIEGIDMMDKGAQRHGKTVFGAIGFGALKIALHRACIARHVRAAGPGARRRGSTPLRRPWWLADPPPLRLRRSPPGGAAGGPAKPDPRRPLGAP